MQMSKFTKLEATLGDGFHPGSLMLLASRPGMGKTSLLRQIANDSNGIYLCDKFDAAGVENVARSASGRILCLDFDTAAQSITGETLKRLAQKYEIPILVATGVSRNCEGREDKRPRLADLDQNLVAAADVVLVLYRESYYHCGISEEPSADEFILLKNAYGEPCTIPVIFHLPARLWSERKN